MRAAPAQEHPVPRGHLAGQPARAADEQRLLEHGASVSAEGRARRPEERSYYNHLGYANYPTQWYSRVALGQVPERSRTAVALVSMS